MYTTLAEWIGRYVCRKHQFLILVQKHKKGRISLLNSILSMLLKKEIKPTREINILCSLKKKKLTFQVLIFPQL